VKIIRNLNNLKIVLKNSLMTPEIKKDLVHTQYNIINLDALEETPLEDETSEKSLDIDSADERVATAKREQEGEEGLNVNKIRKNI
jgi:hypothetical protein